MRAQCRQRVGKPRARIEELKAEGYGEPPKKATRETKETKPTPAKPPDQSNPTPVRVNPAEPLDGPDPNPRSGE